MHLLWFLLLLLVPNIFVQCALHFDQSAAENLKSHILKNFPLSPQQLLLIQKPFYPIDYSLLDTTTWSKNGAKTLHPLISWSEMLNRIPFLNNKQEQLYFVDSTLNIDYYLSQLFSNYEWVDTPWNYDQCTFNCKLDMPQTILTMQSAIEQLEILYNQCTPANLTCVSAIQGPASELQQLLATTQQIYELQKQIMNDHGQKNIHVKMMQYYQTISNSMLRNLNDFSLGEFYPVSFSPPQFLNYLQYSTTSLLQFSQQEVIDNWLIQTIKLPNLNSCQWNLKLNRNLLVEISKELKISPSQLQSGKLDVISSNEKQWNDFVQRMLLRTKQSILLSEIQTQCQEISLEMTVAYVKVQRDWFSMSIFDEPIGVNGVKAYEWSDGQFGGTFPSYIDGFFVAKQIVVSHFNGTNDVIDMTIDVPSILAFTTRFVPSFPRKDSIEFSKQNSTVDVLSTVSTNITNNGTDWNQDVFSLECCGRPTSYNCPIPRLKVQTESKMQVITMQQNLTQELNTLSSNMADALRDVTTWSASLLTFTILNFVISSLWPFVATALILLTWRNTLKQIKN